jgi:hypothetical protein
VQSLARHRARRLAMKLHRESRATQADKCAGNVESLDGNSAAMISSTEIFHVFLWISWTTAL